MQLRMIYEDTDEQGLIGFLEKTINFEVELGSDMYVVGMAEISIPDVKSLARQVQEEFGWYLKEVSLGGGDRLADGLWHDDARQIHFAPVAGRPVNVPSDQHGFVYHFPGPKHTEKIQTEGLIPQGWSGRSGGMWSHYPPRTFVWTSLRASVGGYRGAGQVTKDQLLCVINPDGFEFYQDEQYGNAQNSPAAYTLDTIPPSSFEIMSYKELKERYGSWTATGAYDDTEKEKRDLP
jgi:hypothetical protein